DAARSTRQHSGHLGLRLILDSTWGHDYENPLSPVQNPHQIKALSNGITLFWTAVIKFDN
ncbi:MAG: hypothetical protein ACYC2E_14370, partial [Sulfuricella sp.]